MAAAGSGLPQSQAWFGVKRQGLAADDGDPVGLYAGTTNGQVFASFEGESWRCLVDYLPEVLAVEAATIGYAASAVRRSMVRSSRPTRRASR